MRQLVTAFAAAAVVAAAAPARAEVPAEEFYLGLTGGLTFPLASWDLGSKSIEDRFEAGTSPQAGLRLGYQFSSQLAFELGAQYLWLMLPEDASNGGLVYQGDLLYHFLDGDWSPFAVGGLGGYYAFAGDLGADPDFQFHLGLGVRGMLTDWLALRVELRDVITDGFSEANTVGGNNLELTAGLDIFPASLLREKDADKDGIIDLADACPQTAGVSSARGCPDQDGDGIADADDACVAEAGKAELKGCPDKDADGVADKDDVCPAEAGKAELNGCPDQDNDGIADKDDACPEAAGKAELKGCPDQDNDGIADKDDACPEAAGKAELKGCPDQDNDGIADKDDACPAVAGKPSLKGCPDKDDDGVTDAADKCPEVRGLPEFEGCLPKEAAKFTGSIKGINFASGKATLLASSFPVLDQAVEVLKKFPSMRIKIEGHTDNTGDAAKNKQLSEERAKSVMDYLIGKGIDAGRLQSEGFGPDRPVADNKTAKGRAENRRVEFNLIAQ